LILDTNALSAFFDNAAGVVAVISAAQRIAIPVIVAGEYTFGIS
jgi:predicted nucleic acid-binding protein